MANYKGFANPSLVISVDDAEHLLDRKDVIFIDTRNYWKYVKGHIPGAFDLELYAFHWVDTSKEGISAFTKQMSFLFSSFGIDASKEVIFYQNNSGYDAARGVWLLNYLGHRRARLLDGGLNLWKRKKLPLSTKDPDIPRPGHFVAMPDDSAIATLDLLSSSVQRADKQSSDAMQILDVRNSGEYSGSYRRALKGGHLPGAINIEWARALRKDGTLKNASQLRKLYSIVEPNRQVSTYCQSGYRAAHSWLVLKLLGFENVRNYLGSWYEWGNNPRAPVVKS